MERTKFIKSLIESAQENIWKNELAIEYTKKFSEEGADKDVKLKACNHALEKDKEYITFLEEKLYLNENKV